MRTHAQQGLSDCRVCQSVCLLITAVWEVILISARKYCLHNSQTRHPLERLRKAGWRSKVLSIEIIEWNHTLISTNACWMHSLCIPNVAANSTGDPLHTAHRVSALLGTLVYWSDTYAPQCLHHSVTLHQRSQRQWWTSCWFSQWWCQRRTPQPALCASCPASSAWTRGHPVAGTLCRNNRPWQVNVHVLWRTLLSRKPVTVHSVELIAFSISTRRVGCQYCKQLALWNGRGLVCNIMNTHI